MKRRPNQIRIQKTAENQAVLDTTDAYAGTPYGSLRSAVYWAPTGGGYVREIDDLHPGTLGRQVCRALAGTGDCLEWDPATGPLARLIRREVQRALRAERRYTEIR